MIPRGRIEMPCSLGGARGLGSSSKGGSPGCWRGAVSVNLRAGGSPFRRPPLPPFSRALAPLVSAPVAPLPSLLVCLGRGRLSGAPGGVRPAAVRAEGRGRGAHQVRHEAHSARTRAKADGQGRRCRRVTALFGTLVSKSRLLVHCLLRWALGWAVKSSPVKKYSPCT